MFNMRLMSKLRHACIILTASIGLSFSLIASADDYSSNSNTVTPAVTIKVSYEYGEGTPLDVAMHYWKKELDERSQGTMRLDLYPNLSLGSKDDLFRRMQQGENIITTADGINYYNWGNADLGIIFGPYLFKNWIEAFFLTHSKWFHGEIDKLAKNQKIRVFSTNWAFGIRHILTVNPVTKRNELRGLRLAVQDNPLHIKAMELYNIVPVKMELNQVDQALASKKIDGVDGPISYIYHSGQYHNAHYLLLTGHIYHLMNLVTSESFWQNLTPEQQHLLKDSANRSAKFHNVVQQADEYHSMQKMQEEGISITTPSPAFLSTIVSASHAFYILRDFRSWSSGLYFKVLSEKSVPWSYYTDSSEIPED